MNGRIFLVAAALVVVGCNPPEVVLGKPAGYRPPVGAGAGGAGRGTPLRARPGHEIATFAGGQFWDVEARFRELPGVSATATGYTGGQVADPNYAEVGKETTGHAEAVVVEFDPRKVSYEELLVAFFRMHDPTRRNAQGAYRGEHYRSAVFYHSIEQRNAAAAMVRRLSAESGKRVVTFVAAAKPFYLAEPEHQQRHEREGTLPTPMPDWQN